MTSPREPPSYRQHLLADPGSARLQWSRADPPIRPDSGRGRLVPTQHPDPTMPSMTRIGEAITSIAFEGASTTLHGRQNRQDRPKITRSWIRSTKPKKNPQKIPNHHHHPWPQPVVYTTSPVARWCTPPTGLTGGAHQDPTGGVHHRSVRWCTPPVQPVYTTGRPQPVVYTTGGPPPPTGGTSTRWGLPPVQSKEKKGGGKKKRHKLNAYPVVSMPGGVSTPHPISYKRRPMPSGEDTRARTRFDPTRAYQHRRPSSVASRHYSLEMRSAITSDIYVSSPLPPSQSPVRFPHSHFPEPAAPLRELISLSAFPLSRFSLSLPPVPSASPHSRSLFSPLPSAPSPSPKPLRKTPLPCSSPPQSPSSTPIPVRPPLPVPEARAGHPRLKLPRARKSRATRPLRRPTPPQAPSRLAAPRRSSPAPDPRAAALADPPPIPARPTGSCAVRTWATTRPPFPCTVRTRIRLRDWLDAPESSQAVHLPASRAAWPSQCSPWSPRVATAPPRTTND
ncbi:hypothetical protein Taro_019863 [Colocasia esculenta]|uniref:Uncharacterized protein n=1 Tax=Colocasia esculenta TaxID=4460 RepID=A0A843V6T1_COLES|nr:hypothetical protein [Colocasia esculenta]